MEAWVGTLLSGLLGGGTIAAILVFIATRKRDKSSDISDRWDDASELAQYIRGEIAKEVEKEVERQVAPMRDKLAKVEKESHELQDAFRDWVVGVWKWNQRGRAGDIPMPPIPILARLGLSNFIDDWPTEPNRT